MPDEEKVNTDESAAVEAPDMEKYYYPPGATEPVLRPEFVGDSTAKLTAAGSETPAADADEDDKPKRGKLPDDFPHVDLLREAGVSTFAHVRALQGDYSSITGIGEARAQDIDAALGE